MSEEKISKHITIAEATKSILAIKLGIKNIPNDAQIEAMKHIAENIFEPLREHFGKPIAITSFFRSEKLNKALKGSLTSQHLLGEAMDIDAHILGGLTNKEIFDWIKSNCNYDQLIWEGGTFKEPDWIHVSLCKNRANRKQTLRMVGGKYFQF
jgi:hypothetical protein